MRRKFLGVLLAAIIAVVGAAAWMDTWTSCTISMNAYSASVIDIGQFAECDCETTVEIHEWGPVTNGQTYVFTYYIRNLGTESLFITYEPFYHASNHDQFRVYMTVHAIFAGLPCQLYELTPSVELLEKDPFVCDRGYLLLPGKVVKVLVTLWVESVVSGGTFNWDLITHGCAP